MSFWIGVLIFAIGILVSVCLHEAGHLLTAKRFGMKATQYFAGFGPTVFSFRRGETEYGLKAVPAGGFVKIVGMTPLEEVAPEDRDRAFWRFPLRQRTVVLAAGSAMHFALALFIFYAAAVTTGLPNPAAQSFDDMAAKPVIGQVADCIVRDYDVTKDGALRACRAADPEAPAKVAGLQHGDRIISVGGTRVHTYGQLVRTLRSTPPGPVEITYRRDGQVHSTTADLVPTRRPALKDEKATGPLQTVSAIGLSVRRPPLILDYGPVTAVGGAVSFLGTTVEQTFQALAKFPSKIPKLLDAIGGQQRDQDTPISVVGASRIGGEAVELGAPIIFLVLLGGLNVFIGVFNLFPLLPLDGGHIAIAWYERARSLLAARRGLPDPGRVDYNKLLPVTYVVILLFGGLTLLTLAADIVNPITLQ
jgi:membrane-associated protease RseP (regulator of RpoE activity)